MDKEIIKQDEMEDLLSKTTNKSLYLGKGKHDRNYYMYLGTEPPIIKGNFISGAETDCDIVGFIDANKIPGLIADSEIIEITVKTKQFISKLL